VLALSYSPVSEKHVSFPGEHNADIFQSMSSPAFSQSMPGRGLHTLTEIEPVEGEYFAQDALKTLRKILVTFSGVNAKKQGRRRKHLPC
jgi:hypothetical protein